MIRILFFIEKFAYNGAIGGAEKVLINLVNHMDPKRFDITVQTLFPDDYAKLLNPNIRYKFCYNKKTSVALFRSRVETQLGLTYMFHIKDDYDIEVAYLEFGTTKVMSCSTNTKAKKVAWVHFDFDVAIKDKKEFVAKASKQYEKYDKVVCVSEKCKDSFVSMFGNDPEVVVVHNVVDDNEIIAKAKQLLPEKVKKRRFTLCILGRFSPQKNYLRLLNSVFKLQKEGFVFDLWILGDGEQRNLIEEYIREHNLSSIVMLYGFQKNPYPFLKAADLLVCSSDYEGFSTFITEGLILGKPIITTDCSGMRELLGDSEYGMITSNDDKDFYEGLKSMLSMSDDQLKCSAEKSFKRGKMFSTANLVKDTELFFENIYSNAAF